MRRHPAALIIALSLACCLGLFATVAHAGPWPRAQGKGFAATSTEIWQAFDGLPAHYSSAFIEYGLTPKLTLGATLSQGTFSGIDTDLFVGLSILQSGPHALSLEAGYTSNTRPDLFTGLPITAEGHWFGLAYGRGFSWGETNGWASAEFKAMRHDIHQRTKLDMTLGLNLQKGWKVMGQAFIFGQDGAWEATMAPGVVMPLTERFNLEMGLRVPSRNRNRTALRIGLWQDF